MASATGRRFREREARGLPADDGVGTHAIDRPVPARARAELVERRTIAMSGLRAGEFGGTDDGGSRAVHDILRSGTTTVISLSGTLDGVSAAMAAIYLLDEADVANGDLYVDMRAVQPVDPGDVVLVAMLRRRLALRGLSLHLTPPVESSLVARPPGRCRQAPSTVRAAPLPATRSTAPPGEAPQLRVGSTVMSIQKRRDGDQCAVTFRRRATNGETCVAIVGDFNGWSRTHTTWRQTVTPGR